MKTLKSGDEEYTLEPYTGTRKGSWDCDVCECPEVYEVKGMFCICSRRVYCEKHGVQHLGTHD